MLERIEQSVMRQVTGLPEGTLIRAAMFSKLASRAAVDQALSRLARKGELLRVKRGLYVCPVQTRFGKRPPAVEKVVMGYAKATGKPVTNSPAASANKLGVSTQVPVRYVYLTSGKKTLRLKVGSQTVELKPAVGWKIVQGPAGEVVRALVSEGKRAAPAVAKKLKGKVSRSLVEELRQNQRIPSWVIKQMTQIEE